jgi:hypothetical protein
MPQYIKQNMATTPEHLPIPTSDKDHNTDRAVTTTIGDWLIDSGCTAHMSNNINDFHVPLEPYETLVEVANGGVTHVQHRGKVDVLINDTYRPDNAIMVTLNNVLYVPGLTRRLLSVHEWNACGGWITLRPDRAILDVYSRDDECIASIEVPPVAGATGTDQVYQVNASQTRQAQSPKRTKVQRRLVHRRLGHRPISTLLLAQQDNNLNDIDPHISDDYITKEGGATTTEIKERQEENEDNQQQDDDDPSDLMEQDNNDSNEETSCDEDDDYELYDEDSRGKDDESEKHQQDEPQQNDPTKTSDVSPLLRMRRRNRQCNAPDRLTMRAFAAATPSFSWIPKELIEYAYHIEVENSIDTSKIDPGSVLPAPGNWRQIMRLPPSSKQLWIASFVKEIKELLKKGTVTQDTPMMTTQ